MVSEEEYQKLKKELNEAISRYNDLDILHSNVVEHGTQLENELEETNRNINLYLSSMKKYLSPQLFELISNTDKADDNAFALKRQRIVCFFSDIVGFSTMTESVEAETLADCLNYYLKAMSDIVLKYDGTLDKFIGDAIMVFFGAPHYDSDEVHANKCVNMAVEMQNAMPEVNLYWKKKGVNFDLKIRIGINTGYVTVGNFGTDERTDYTIIGNQVNLASRLENSATPGKILISESTKILVEDEFEFVPKGKINVKGIHYPVAIYEVIGDDEEVELQDVINPDNLFILEDSKIHFKGLTYKMGSDKKKNETDKKALIKTLKDVISRVQSKL